MGDSGAARRSAPKDRRARSRRALVAGRDADSLRQGRESAGDALFVARADGGSSRELVPVRGGMHIHWPAWSRDGRHIYFNYTSTTSNSEPAGIYRVAAAGGPIEPVVTSARRAVFPVPMPDGSGLIYSANPTSVDLALWWRPFDRPDPVRLTTGVGEYAETSIAPDGRTMISAVVQYRQALTGVSGVCGRRSPRPITDGSTGDFDPILSPGGDQLVFSSSRSGFRNIWTARPDGTMARALTSGNAFDERPAFSPDGRRLAFVSDRGGRRSIWTISADGGIPEQLVTADVIDRLVWAPDGRGIVFATTVDDQPTLQIVSVPTGAVQRVRTPGPAVGPFGFADGHHRIPRAVSRRTRQTKHQSCGVRADQRRAGVSRRAEKPWPGQRVCRALCRWPPSRRRRRSRRGCRLDLGR